MVLTGTTILAILGATLITGGAAALGKFVANEVINIAKDIKKNESLSNTDNITTENKTKEIENEIKDINTEDNIVPMTPEQALPPKNNKGDRPTSIPIINPTTNNENQIPNDENINQEIVDKTDENIGTNNIGNINWLDWAKEQQQAQWEREDQIRKETQEREDTAYQRAIADMRKAGINPNLVGVNPAQSGGGITQATGQDLTGLVNSMNIDADKLMQIIDNNFQGNENEKERLLETITSILSSIGMIIAFKK